MQGVVSYELPFYKGVMAIVQMRSNDLYANRMSHTDDGYKGNNEERKGEHGR